MKSLTPAELTTLQQQGAQLVDVRSPQFFARDGWPGAINAPLAEIQMGQHQLPRTIPLVLLCERGLQSQLAALYLEADGYTEVYNLAGGLIALRDADQSGA
jgi:rhodanese-related sulfurtransferase